MPAQWRPPTPVAVVAAAPLLAALLLPGCVGPIAAPDSSDGALETPDPAAAHSEHASVPGPWGWDPETPPDLHHEPPFPLEAGHRPTRDEARDFPNRFSHFIVDGDRALDELRAEGYLKGEGTRDRPYVLDRFYVDQDLSISNTHRAFVLSQGYVGDQLRLNYIGPEVYVHHVYAKDLRINENVKRSGTNTGGLFHDDQFGFVGQIRHFIGEFRNNEIGPRPQNGVASFLGDSGLTALAPEVVFNLDGFHGADVHDNHFLGFVDIKLHGHNHGDCFTCPVHNHADPAEAPGNASAPQTLASDDPARTLGFRSHHSVRYASLLFRNNLIEVSSGPALRYKDAAHAADDRTANSEPSTYLNDPHVHFQDVTIRDNRLDGGGLVVQIYNAADDHHPVQNRGILRILHNEITVRYGDEGILGRTPAQLDGIRIERADGLELRLLDNLIGFEATSDHAPLLPGRGPTLAGIRYEGVDAANLTMAGNRVMSGSFGVYAAHLTEFVHWSLAHNEFHTDVAWRGQDVKNPPEEP